jgi:hypothetical protein
VLAALQRYDGEPVIPYCLTEQGFGLAAPLCSAELNFVESEDQHPILEVDHHDAESAHFQKPASPIEHGSGIARFVIGIVVKIGRG